MESLHYYTAPHYKFSGVTIWILLVRLAGRDKAVAALARVWAPVLGALKVYRQKAEIAQLLGRRSPEVCPREFAGKSLSEYNNALCK